MTKENAIVMLKHWILDGKSYGLAPGINDLAAIVKELETDDLPMGSAIYMADARKFDERIRDIEQRLTDLEAISEQEEPEPPQVIAPKFNQFDVDDLKKRASALEAWKAKIEGNMKGAPRVYPFGKI
jgi:hypothetical protein